MHRCYCNFLFLFLLVLGVTANRFIGLIESFKLNIIEKNESLE